MQGRQLPPIVEFTWSASPGLQAHPTNRKRNRSLHLNPELNQAPTPSLPLKRQPVYTSRKNKLLLKQLKHKQGRDYTRRCQDNIDQYITLRNIALENNKSQHSPQGSEGQSVEQKTNLSQRAYVRNKLSLKMLTFPEQTNLTVRTRCRTEGNVEVVKEQKPVTNVAKVKPLKMERGSASLPKQYKEMSVEEITGSGRGKGRLIERLRQFRASIEQRKGRRKESDEMLIEGW